jgi:long-chain acyl-CoA synthetase
MITMTSALLRTEKLYGKRLAIIDTEVNYTWKEHVARIKKLAGGLTNLGITKGDRFGIIGPNSFRYTELIHAGYWAGAIPVPINHRLAPPEILHILEDAEVKLLALGEDYLALTNDEILKPWANKRIVIGSSSPDAKIPALDVITETGTAITSHNPDESELAILLYTGGTTGRSKGVQLTHRNVCSNGYQVINAMNIVKEDIYLHVAPQFHAADLLGSGFTMNGSAHAYVPIFSPKAVLQAIQDYKVTQAMMAPTMIIMILEEPTFDNYDISSYRNLFYGSSPMAAEWVEKAIQRFTNAGVQQGYGLTETSPILTTFDADDHRHAMETGNTDILRAAGRPLIGIDLKILNDNDTELPTGETGEVCVRGPNVTPGYLNRPDENKKAFKNGWFHTGDVGKVDENGILFLMDRKKDMIVSGGENIYTSEVEAALYKHPDVFECAVIGVPDYKYGETLLAVIVPVAGKNLKTENIIQHCRELIAGFKIPRQIDFVAELPKSAMSKILKNELRKIYSKNL